ncbi:MAG TPA: hypothetical protein VFF27_00785 [Bacteroidia bacterium]|jgi:hypothetical protein|nr:hypothetical protein [Bacteroidia bacterium]
MYHNSYKQSLVFLLLFFSSFLLKKEGTIFSQNLEKIGAKDMLKVNGGLNFNSIFLNSNNPNSTRAPFSWYLNGNVTLSVLDWSIPFSYSYSNQHSTYSQPFNQYGLAPTYKWIKAYAGWSNMSFSQYTFSGYPFLGGGVELTPNNWKIALMYGRLKKAIEYDAINETDRDMSFKRMGMGAKVGYEKSGYGLNLTWFHAKDDVNSLTFIPETTQIQPQENTVVSAAAKAPVTKFFNLETEYALSGFSRNIFADEAPKGSNNKLPFIFKPRTSSEFYSAFKSSLTFNSKFISCGINYERIDPNYKTLGIYYMNNDIENITLSPQFRLFKSKLNVSVNAGVQHNNLNKEKLSTMRRVVGSGTIAFVPNQKWNFNASYSNFTSYTRNRPVTDPFYITSPADTMKFYQVSQTGNGTVSHNFGNEKRRNIITLMSAYQVSRQEVGSVTSDPTKMLNGNISYGLQFVPTKLMVSVCVNANTTKAPGANAAFVGPGINVGKSFFQNTMNCTLGSIYNLSYLNEASNGSALNERLSVTYSPKLKDKKFGKPTAGLSVNYVTRKTTQVNSRSLNELTINANISYAF